MLARKYRLSKKDFETAFNTKGKYLKSDFLSFKIVKNSLKLSRFGISCGTKISKKATVRNRIKRRISESIRLKLDKINPGYDILVMASPQIKERDYQEIDKAILILLNQANLIS